MNITTRGLDKDVINIIDSKAKKQNISRNEYIKKLITYDSNNYALKQEKKNLKLWFLNLFKWQIKTKKESDLAFLEKKDNPKKLYSPFDRNKMCFVS